MNHTILSRHDLVKAVALNVSCLLTVILAACGYRQWCSGSDDKAERTRDGDGSGGCRLPSTEDEYRLYGAKTAYDEVREKTVEEVRIPGCVPKQFWLLSRHGARYPGPCEMDALIARLPALKESILQNAKVGRGCLPTEDLSQLKNWSTKFHPDLDNQLTPWGQKEMTELEIILTKTSVQHQIAVGILVSRQLRQNGSAVLICSPQDGIDLAQRFKQRFPSLLSRDFSTEVYSFRHTDSHRTAVSARLFAAGLFGNSDEICIPKPVKDDPIIKFYKTCKKWKEEVDDNDDAKEERTRFRTGPEMQKVVEAVSTRLGFEQKLPFEDVHLMFAMCRFENAIHPDKTSPWCSVFCRDEVEVMEYDEDLDYYWTDGYGYPINYEQACPPVKDFLDHFRAVMKSEAGSPLGVFRFSHSGLLLKVYARLGLFRDATPPRADNFSQQTSRKWRSSLIDPFTANLALVLFKCSDGYKLMAYVQEREVVLPGCNDILCPMETVIANYASLADACDVTEICGGYREHIGYCRGQGRNKKYPRLAQQLQQQKQQQKSALLSSSSVMSPSTSASAHKS